MNWFPELNPPCWLLADHDEFVHLSFITGQNHFARHKDEQDDARLHHAVDESRKQLWFITENKQDEAVILKIRVQPRRNPLEIKGFFVKKLTCKTFHQEIRNLTNRKLKLTGMCEKPIKHMKTIK